MIRWMCCECIVDRVPRGTSCTASTSNLGYVDILVIANLIFFQVLPQIGWRGFFYSLGSAGARFYYMVIFASEIFIVLCEVFIAISRYLTFIRSDLNYWNTDRIHYWLLAIVGVSVAPCGMPKVFALNLPLETWTGLQFQYSFHSL
ncbi:unnamed protein product [Cylicocyclus nassatus]|uniref:Uncharacterized protein n=1 Tax=Cylicocyclus nassatus TaxID=53992 RepID=A0AA36HCX3_CYLNA|nr:unnamed protein product [Cylicocyclus nassatus]